MTIGELGSYVDPSRIAVTCTSCADLFYAYAPNMYVAGVWTITLGAMLSMIFLSRHSNWAIATPAVSVGQWTRKFPPFKWWVNRMKERAMRKERFEVREEEMTEEIVEFIESKRSAELWSDLECDIEYTRLKSRYPVLSYAIDNPKAAREAVVAYFKQRQEKRRAAPVTLSTMRSTS